MGASLASVAAITSNAVFASFPFSNGKHLAIRNQALDSWFWNPGRARCHLFRTAESINDANRFRTAEPDGLVGTGGRVSAPI
jgi:hypothetical protein